MFLSTLRKIYVITLARGIYQHSCPNLKVVNLSVNSMTIIVVPFPYANSEKMSCSAEQKWENNDR